MFSQSSNSSASVEEVEKTKDNIDKCIYHIFTYLKPNELAACSEVCNQWCRISAADTLWKPLVKTHLGIEPESRSLQQLEEKVHADREENEQNGEDDRDFYGENRSRSSAPKDKDRPVTWKEIFVQLLDEKRRALWKEISEARLRCRVYKEPLYADYDTYLDLPPEVQGEPLGNRGGYWRGSGVPPSTHRGCYEQTLIPEKSKEMIRNYRCAFCLSDVKEYDGANDNLNLIHLSIDDRSGRYFEVIAEYECLICSKYSSLEGEFRF